MYASILELCDNQKEILFLELKALKDGIATFKEVKEISDKIANLQDQELRITPCHDTTIHIPGRTCNPIRAIRQ